MSFADDLAAELKQGPPCSVSVALGNMDKKLAVEVEDAIRTRLDIPAAAIARKLTAMDYAVNGGAVLRHRKGECQCRSLTT